MYFIYVYVYTDIHMYTHRYFLALSLKNPRHNHQPVAISVYRKYLFPKKQRLWRKWLNPGLGKAHFVIPDSKKAKERGRLTTDQKCDILSF